jgi:hypothetical protein
LNKQKHAAEWYHWHKFYQTLQHLNLFAHRLKNKVLFAIGIYMCVCGLCGEWECEVGVCVCVYSVVFILCVVCLWCMWWVYGVCVVWCEYLSGVWCVCCVWVSFFLVKPFVIRMLHYIV